MKALHFLAYPNKGRMNWIFKIASFDKGYIYIEFTASFLFSGTTDVRHNVKDREEENLPSEKKGKRFLE